MIKQKFNKTLYHDIFRLQQMILHNGSRHKKLEGLRGKILIYCPGNLLEQPSWLV